MGVNTRTRTHNLNLNPNFMYRPTDYPMHKHMYNHTYRPTYSLRSNHNNAKSRLSSIDNSSSNSTAPGPSIVPNRSHTSWTLLHSLSHSVY
jgi:hypothetical protein